MERSRLIIEIHILHNIEQTRKPSGKVLKSSEAM